jgi:formaldehyde-activating enzyme involved in methanogenesis
VTDSLDGRIGEGWSGEVPNGSHINLVLARRGSPTAAEAAAVLAG